MSNNAYTPNSVRTAGGQEVPIDSFGDRVMWSSALVGSDQANDVEYFDYAKGQLVTGDNNSSVKADERHTNVRNKGTMSIDQAMNVHSIGFELPYDVSLVALGQLSDQLYFEFKNSGSNPVYSGLVRHFPAGNGAWISSVANAEAARNNGSPDQKRFHFNQPMLLAAGKDYSVTGEVKGTMAMASVDILLRCVFRGMGVSAP